MIPNRKSNRFSNQEQAFTLSELGVVIGSVILLGLIAVTFGSWIREKSRIATCSANLKQLARAMSLYEKSNDERLPFAFVEYRSDKFISWDRLIDSYVPREGGAGNPLRCPTDTIPAKGADPRRTYSMPGHSMDARNWPPGPDNTTGIGLWWAPKGKLHAAIAALNLKTNNVPAVVVDMIHSPASTLLLTEQAQAYNLQFSFSGAAVESPSSQLDTKAIPPGWYHGGKFDYLMVDGHVELLSPLQSLGENDPVFDHDPRLRYPNVWTIKHDPSN